MTDQKLSLLLLLPLLTGNDIYSCFLQGSTFGYSIAHSLASFSSESFVQIKTVMFPCLLCIMVICTHFILMFAVIVTFTLTADCRASDVFHCISMAVNVVKESELSSSEYVKCL